MYCLYTALSLKDQQAEYLLVYQRLSHNNI